MKEIIEDLKNNPTLAVVASVAVTALLISTVAVLSISHEPREHHGHHGNHHSHNEDHGHHDVIVVPVSPGDSGSDSTEPDIVEPFPDFDTTAAAEVGNQIIGMSEAEALKIAESAGVSTRVGRRDGESFALTMDYRPDRLTLEIDRGIITGASIG